MKRTFAIVILLLAIASFLLVQAQQTVGVATNPLGGPISASSTNCSVAQACVWMRLPFNVGSISVNIIGTFSETLQVEESNDGGSTFVNVASLSSAGLTTYEIAGMSDFRIRCSSFVSGIAFINMQAGLAAGAAHASSDAASNSVLPSFGTFAFNGATWDRYFYCPNTATFSVVSTVTQVVALSGTTKIRVCSTTFFPSTATAGSVDLVYGTGSSCATGITTLTGAATLPAAAVVSIPLSISSTGPLITPAGQALCVRTVTSTVAGFLTWVQY
jgi:hypothetical protein